MFIFPSIVEDRIEAVTFWCQSCDTEDGGEETVSLDDVSFETAYYWLLEFGEDHSNQPID